MVPASPPADDGELLLLMGSLAATGAGLTMATGSTLTTGLAFLIKGFFLMIGLTSTTWLVLGSLRRGSLFRFLNNSFLLLAALFTSMSLGPSSLSWFLLRPPGLNREGFRTLSWVFCLFLMILKGLLTTGLVTNSILFTAIHGSRISVKNCGFTKTQSRSVLFVLDGVLVPLSLV